MMIHMRISCGLIECLASEAVTVSAPQNDPWTREDIQSAVATHDVEIDISCQTIF